MHRYIPFFSFFLHPMAADVRPAPLSQVAPITEVTASSRERSPTTLHVFTSLSPSLPPPQSLTVLSLSLFFFPSLRLVHRRAVCGESSPAGGKRRGDGNGAKIAFPFRNSCLRFILSESDGASRLGVIGCGSAYVKTQPQCLFNMTWMLRSPEMYIKAVCVCVCALVSL